MSRSFNLLSHNSQLNSRLLSVNCCYAGARRVFIASWVGECVCVRAYMCTYVCRINRMTLLLHRATSSSRMFPSPNPKLRAVTSTFENELVISRLYTIYTVTFLSDAGFCSMRRFFSLPFFRKTIFLVNLRAYY